MADFGPKSPKMGDFGHFWGARQVLGFGHLETLSVEFQLRPGKKGQKADSRRILKVLAKSGLRRWVSEWFEKKPDAKGIAVFSKSYEPAKGGFERIAARFFRTFWPFLAFWEFEPSLPNLAIWARKSSILTKMAQIGIFWVRSRAEIWGFSGVRSLNFWGLYGNFVSEIFENFEGKFLKFRGSDFQNWVGIFNFWRNCPRFRRLGLSRARLRGAPLATRSAVRLLKKFRKRNFLSSLAASRSW